MCVSSKTDFIWSDMPAEIELFVLSICFQRVKPVLVQFIMEMVPRYLEVHKVCMRGKVCHI